MLIRPLLLTAALTATLAPSLATACGGLFCNAAQPIEQAAERILFIVDGAQIHMHVQLTYSGPPADFGWLLPAPPGVETALSSESLFQALDALHTPQFRLDTQYDPMCERPDWGLFSSDASTSPDAGAADGASDAGPPDPPPPVQVLSREAVGPYDRAILVADDMGALREWLDDNEFAIPPETDEKLIPYIEAGAHFVAIRLLADAQARDVVPLMLSFPSDRPVIPIVPTAVAATPDMGIVVHVLGDSRAVPLNYLHVEVNEAAVDWEGQGRNYADVVAQAADEAGGKAFATDYAGPVDEQLTGALVPLTDEFLRAVEGLESVRDLDGIRWPNRNDPDILRVFATEVGVPDGVPAASFFGCPSCFNAEDAEIDGAALAARLRSEVQPARAHLTEQFEAHRYLTRLFSAMSPAEMDLDPVFSFNQDLDPVERVRQAVLWVPCNAPVDGAELGVDWNWAAREIRLADGRTFAPGEPIQRQGGELLRGNVPAARRIDQLTEAGQPMRVDEMDPHLPGGDAHEPDPNADPGGARSDSDSGCACDTVGDAGGLGLLGLLSLGLISRRRISVTRAG